VVQAGEAQAALAVEQVERAEHPGPQATQAAGPAVRAATALLNPLAAKAVRMAMALLNPPAARAKTVSIPQGPELDRGAPVPARAERAAPPDSDRLCSRPFHQRLRHGVPTEVNSTSSPTRDAPQ
jgi:hypothetical protein